MTSRDSHPTENEFHPTTTHHPSYSNQSPYYSRPVDSARNGWQVGAHEGSQRGSSSPADDINSPGWSQMALSVASAPRFRRLVLIYIALFIFAWIGWRMLLSPRLQDQNFLLHSLHPTSKTDTGWWFGVNSSPQSGGLVQIRTLNPDLVPGDLAGVKAGKSSRKRLIIVGDVHGCKEECK